MADKKISALTPATLPLDGTEVLPIVQSGSTVKATNNSLRPLQVQSKDTSGVLQITGPAAAATRVMTTPDANFTAARIDAAQTFTGTQTFSTVKTVYSTPTYYGQLDAHDGNVWLTFAGGGDLYLYNGSRTDWIVGNAGNLVQNTAAKGINFTANTPAAGMTSQLLNWYEEGTFTPTAVFSTSQGDLSYAFQVGRYTRVGNAVSIEIALRFSETTASGEVTIAGLPFATANTTNLLVGGGMYVDNLTGLSGGPCFYVAPNTTVVHPIYSGTGTRTAIDNTNTAANATFYVAFTYFV